jgi:acetyl esterase
MILTAECDPIRDQGEAYSRLLEQAGVPVTVKRYEGAIHAFLNMSAAIDAGKEALDDAASTLRRAFATSALASVP